MYFRLSHYDLVVTTYQIAMREGFGKMKAAKDNGVPDVRFVLDSCCKFFNVVSFKDCYDRPRKTVSNWMDKDYLGRSSSSKESQKSNISGCLHAARRKTLVCDRNSRSKQRNGCLFYGQVPESRTFW